MKKTLFILAASLVVSGNAFAGGAAHFEKRDWEFDSLTAEWDKDTIQRGYTVATQVCMSCHGFKYISHRNLMEVGFSEAEAMTMAAELGVKMNDSLLSAMSAEDAKDTFGKAVPDLAIMNRARGGGADYVYALMTGYSEEIPMDFEGMNYNTAFPGNNIAMPAPLMDDLVEFHDGTAATVEQMAHDVAYFMQWTSEPEMLDRKKTGVYVILYLILLSILLIALKKRVWRRVH